MDKSVVEGWIRENLERAKAEFGLGAWRIEVVCGTEPEGCACTRVEPPYERAKIWIDPEQMDDPAELCEVLEHELLHVVHASMRDFLEVIRKVLGDDVNFDVVNEAYLQACERVTRNMERLVAALRASNHE